MLGYKLFYICFNSFLGLVVLYHRNRTHNLLLLPIFRFLPCFSMPARIYYHNFPNNARGKFQILPYFFQAENFTGNETGFLPYFG